MLAFRASQQSGQSQVRQIKPYRACLNEHHSCNILSSPVLENFKLLLPTTQMNHSLSDVLEVQINKQVTVTKDTTEDSVIQFTFLCVEAVKCVWFTVTVNCE